MPPLDAPQLQLLVPPRGLKILLEEPADMFRPLQRRVFRIPSDFIEVVILSPLAHQQLFHNVLIIRFACSSIQQIAVLGMVILILIRTGRPIREKWVGSR